MTLAVVSEDEALLSAYRAEFLHACIEQGMSAANAAECQEDFERDSIDAAVLRALDAAESVSPG